MKFGFFPEFRFKRSMKGTGVTAILYSIWVLCAWCGVDPKNYLSKPILRIRNGRGSQFPFLDAFANKHESLILI
ncbi:hypothetical protein APED_27885 [Acanthopleuribacter pedis]